MCSPLASVPVFLEETGDNITTISALLPAGTAAEEGGIFRRPVLTIIDYELPH